MIPFIDPEDPDVLRIPRPDGKGTYPLILISKDDPDLVSDAWCLMCEALDDKPWRFTEEQAERIEWLICGEHSDLIGMVLEQTG